MGLRNRAQLFTGRDQQAHPQRILGFQPKVLVPLGNWNAELERERSSWCFWANKVRGKLHHHRREDANNHSKQDRNAAYNSKTNHLPRKQVILMKHFLVLHCQEKGKGKSHQTNRETSFCTEARTARGQRMGTGVMPNLTSGFLCVFPSLIFQMLYNEQDLFHK